MDEMAQPQAVETANQPGMEGNGGGVGAAESTGAAERAGEASPFLTVRYNKEDKPLSREEAATYAQKGMNYDKLSERLRAADEQLKTMSGVKTLAQQYAARRGVSEAEAVSALSARLSGKDGQAVVDAQLEAFEEAHPDVDPRELPQDVIAAWKRGVPLLEAYGMQQTRQTLRQARAQAANERNAAASMGGAGSMGAAHPQLLSDETIQSMSPAELDKNHARIWAYLTGKKA